MTLSLGRCLHCGETLSPINYGAVCRDYPVCVVLKGMFPLVSAQDASTDLARGDVSESGEERNSDASRSDERGS